MRSFVLFILIAAVAASASPGAPRPPRPLSVGYLTIDGHLTTEDSAAVSWLAGEKAFSVRVLIAESSLLDRPGVDVVWIHVPDSAAWTSWAREAGKFPPLASFYRQGGKFLCTGLAAMVPYLAGIESEKPEILPVSISDDGLFDQKGLQGFRGHPVYDGFFGGLFTWDTNVDNVEPRVGYFRGRYPREGKVVGVEKSTVMLESDNKLMIEYASGKGRGITIGAFVRFSPTNAKAAHLRRFIDNTLRYIGGARMSARPTYWLKADDRPRLFSIRTSPLSPGRSLAGRLPESGLRITRDHPGNEFFDVAGRRALVMGRENGGIDELWVHPFRVLRDFRAGLVSGDSIHWLDESPVSVAVRPESFTRTYRTAAGTLNEIVFPSFRRGGALVHYAWEDGARGSPLIVTFRSDLRWMWPYDERALGDVCYGYDEGLHALHVSDRSGDFRCIIGGSIPPRRTISGPFDRIVIREGELRGDTSRENQVFHAAVYDFGDSPVRSLDVGIVGTDMGKERARADYRAIMSDPSAEYARLVRHYRSLLDRTVTLETPDSAFDALWRWAIVGADRFVAETPRLGTALLAGFSTVNRGWDGGHRISGRPGYAWYFGRDSEWSGFALDDEGDFATVRGQLEFLQKYQDLSGKILHELSTSGVVHYDAADATPLYIVLAAHYLRASGDRDFLRASWPHIRKAMDFLYSTDTDGDLLIENTGVGHGWVEGGKLWPVHTEFYLAGVWGEALQDASQMAALIGDKDLAAKYGRDAAAVKKKVDSDFWDPATGSYRFGKLKDGSYNPEPTVLAAPVMYFGWLDDAKALRELKRYAGGAFSTDWGMRIVGDTSPLFSPTGYHYGSVWPLFTGWTSLAAYEYGNSAQAFTLMNDNMEIKNHWAAGFVEEVMNGAVYTPSGVCPHQCWSETNILHPGIHGMIGWTPDATGHRAVISPRFPIHWDAVRVRNLRAGASLVDFAYERRGRASVYRMSLRHGGPLAVDFSPEIPEGTDHIQIAVDGIRISVPVSIRRGLLDPPLRLSLKDSVEVRCTRTGGVGVIPIVSHPVPGDSSSGVRLISASLTGTEYAVDVEGKPGSAGTIGIRALDQKVLSVSGGTLIGENPDGSVAIGVAFGPSNERRCATRVVVRLQEVQR